MQQLHNFINGEGVYFTKFKVQRVMCKNISTPGTISEHFSCLKKLAPPLFLEFLGSIKLHLILDRAELHSPTLSSYKTTTHFHTVSL